MVFPINIAATKLFYQFSVTPNDTDSWSQNFYGIFEVNATRLVNKNADPNNPNKIGISVDLVPSGVIIAVYESTLN